MLNWLPARLTALLLWPVGQGAALWRNAGLTPSPNGGWPMGAMALSLGVRLGKPGVYTLNAQGRAREFQLRLKLAFRLTDAKGREMIGPTLIGTQRDVSFNDAQVLAKESEEALLFRDMQSDAVQQLLRRLHVVKLEPPKP